MFCVCLFVYLRYCIHTFVYNVYLCVVYCIRLCSLMLISSHPLFISLFASSSHIELRFLKAVSSAYPGASGVENEDDDNNT